MAKTNGPAVLTANDLLTGAIVYWTGARWSERFAEAARADAAERDTLTAVGADEEARNVVVGAYLVTLGADGAPALLRERQRLAGPSIALPSNIRQAA